MKRFITFFFIILSINSIAQTQLCEVYHGCGGATVTAYASDPAWTNVTYMFQRFDGINWATVHTTTTNWHMVTPGDIVVPSNYRAVLRNNLTLEERVSNGVTVNPALFYIAVLPPNPVIIMHWLGVDSSFAEVRPYPFGPITNNYRPPFTFEYKKTTDAFWQNRVATTGIGIPIDPNVPYQFRVTDICGQTSNIVTAQLQSLATAVLDLSLTNCSGGSLQVDISINGENSQERFPFTFGLALLPPGTPTNPVPDAILNSLVYQYPAGNISGLAHGQYVVRGKDHLGVLTKYTVAFVNINPAAPNNVAGGPGSGYCLFNETLESNPYLKGIRPAGSSQPYAFSTGLTFFNLQGGQTYETVLKDTCGRIGPVSLLPLPALSPLINNTPVTVSNCKYVITVNANVCSTAEYGIKLSGSSTVNWQTSNVFGNLPMAEACHTIFVKDINSGLVAQKQVCTDGIMANVSTGWDYPGCENNYGVAINPYTGVPPYTYSISYDGINFTNPGTMYLFSGLPPGTYTLRATDACGLALQTDASVVELGSVFYLKQLGVNSNCTNGDTLGGYVKFGLRLFKDDQVLSPPPYHFSIKEVISISGNEVYYGNTVYSGQSTDTIITIKGLDGNKHYGLFVSNDCGKSFTSAGRALNVFYIPAFSSPVPEIIINTSNCDMPFIQANNLPAGAIVRIFSGQDTTGTLQPMTNTNTSAVLAGGYYSVKINTANYNGCYWERVYTLFIKTNDSTSAGQLDPNVSSIFCAGVSTPVSLYNNIIGKAPGGIWSSVPELNWSDQDAGEIIPADQPEGIYNITYAVTSYCGITKQVNFQIGTSLDACSLTQWGDYESAMTPSGCKTYTGNEWKHVFNSSGNLVYSINAGIGNTIQSACWGVRAVPTYGNLRSTVINGSTVYFAARNFYIEPSGTTIANPPVRIRLYYTYDELNQLLNYLHTHGFPAATVNDLRILKKTAGPGSPVNLDVAYDPGASSSLYSIITPVAVPYGYPGSYYFEFEISSFSELAIVFSNNFTLPVTWLYINGQLQNGNTLIKWATASESNTDKFEIEHGTNGSLFTKIGEVAAAGSSSMPRYYSFNHNIPTEGFNYYRIKQVDHNGTFRYSTIVTLLNRDGILQTILAPNPAKEMLHVAEPKETYIVKVEVFQLNGVQVFNQQINRRVQAFTIPVKDLPAGQFVLKIHYRDKIATRLFLKQ